MKKLVLVGIIAALVLGGCTQGTKEVQDAGDASETKEESAESTGTEQKDPVDDPAEGEKDKADEPAETKSVVIKVYTSDETAENLLTKEVQIPELKEQEVWKAIKETSQFSPECELLSFSQEEGVLKLDVNKAFGDMLRGMGTSGERMIMGSVVNTFLDAYGCESMVITEEGSVLQSGHAEYSENITKY